MLALTSLTGCGKHDSGTQGAGNSGPVDAAKVLNAAAAYMHPEAGRWESTVKVNHMDMPGMAPQMRDAMQHAMAGASVIATCLTPEQAAQPGSTFFTGRAHHDCAYDSFTMADGNLNAVMHCSGASTHMKMTMNGTYDANSYQLHSTMQMAMPGGGTMTQDANTTSKRVGACTGTEINSGTKG
jgi:hypothetical protein